MKQVFLLMAFFGLAAVTSLNAQCTKSAAARVASLSSDIIEKKDPATGELKYLKKKVCPATGEVSYTSVEFCSKTAQFVNATPTYKASCVKSASACSKAYGKNTMMVSNDLPAHCLMAQKAACLTATQKTQTAKAAFASLDNKVIVRP